MESQNVRIGVVKNELSEEDGLQQRHITATSEIKMCTVVPTESCIYLCLFKKKHNFEDVEKATIFFTVWYSESGTENF